MILSWSSSMMFSISEIQLMSSAMACRDASFSICNCKTRGDWLKWYKNLKDIIIQDVCAALRPGVASLVQQEYESAAQPTECRCDPEPSSDQLCLLFSIEEAGCLCSAQTNAKTTWRPPPWKTPVRCRRNTFIYYVLETDLNIAFTCLTLI